MLVLSFNEQKNVVELVMVIDDIINDLMKCNVVLLYCMFVEMVKEN